MNERLDKYHSLQEAREKRHRELHTDRWEAVKSWLGVFAFCVSIPTFFISAINSYYSVILRHEHLGLVLTRHPIALPNLDTRLIYFLDDSLKLQGIFFNSGNRGIAVQLITLTATIRAGTKVWNEDQCFDHAHFFEHKVHNLL